MARRGRISVLYVSKAVTLSHANTAVGQQCPIILSTIPKRKIQMGLPPWRIFGRVRENKTLLGPPATLPCRQRPENQQKTAARLTLVRKESMRATKHGLMLKKGVSTLDTDSLVRVHGWV